MQKSEVSVRGKSKCEYVRKHKRRIEEEEEETLFVIY